MILLGLATISSVFAVPSVNAINKESGLNNTQLAIHQKNLEDQNVIKIAEALDKKFDQSDSKAQEKIDKILEDTKKLSPSKLLSARKYNRDKNTQNKERNKKIDKLESNIQAKVSHLFGENTSMVNLSEDQKIKFETEFLKDASISLELKDVQDVNYQSKPKNDKLVGNIFGSIKANAATTSCGTGQFYSSVAKSAWNSVSIWKYPTGWGDDRNDKTDYYCDYLVYIPSSNLNYVGSWNGTGQCVLNQFSLISANSPKNLFVFGSLRSALCGVFDSQTVKNNVAFRS